MAKAMKYPSVFKALLWTGHICVRQPVQGKIKYTVHVSPRTIGHITETQFQALQNEGLLRCVGTRNDKSGDSLSYFVLAEV